MDREYFRAIDDQVLDLVSPTEHVLRTHHITHMFDSINAAIGPLAAITHDMTVLVVT